MGGVEYQVTKVDPTDSETKGMVYQVHKVSEEIAATLGGKVYRARIINDPTDPTVAGKVYQIVLIGDPSDPAVKGKVYNAILTGGSEAVVVGPAVSPLVLPDAVAGELGYVKAFGGIKQNGTPTPDAPVDIVSNNGVLKVNSQGQIYTDGTVETIQVHGTNVFNKNATDALLLGFPAADGKWNETQGFRAICCKLLEGKTYTITRVTSSPTSSAMRVIAYDKVPTANYYGTPLFIGNNTNKTATITVPTGSPYIVTYVKHSADSITDQDLLDGFHIELGETALDYQPYFDGGTATTEMLLKLFNKNGDTIYAQDAQNVTTGEITRNVGVRAFVGTETWTMGTNQDVSNNRVFYVMVEDRKIQDTNMGLLCSHFNFKGTVGYATLATGEFCINQSIKSVYFDGNGITTVDGWKQWLANQVAAGTPLIVIYPLAEPTTESVTGQTLQVTDGDNIVEITQASLEGLELEARYDAAVTLTVQEAEDANLDNNVTLTIQ